MSYSANDLALMANALEQSEDYRVLRRLVPRALSKPPMEDSKIGILLEPIQEEWIHEQGLGLVKRLSMRRIMARRMKAATVRA